MIVDLLDRRVLGAVRFLSDVDQLPIPGPLQITVLPPAVPDPAAPAHPAFSILRNRLGWYVIRSTPGFQDYLDRFDPPPVAPPLFSRTFRLQVVDPLRRHFPARFDLALPRTLNSQRTNGAFAADSVFAPVDIRLLPAPKAEVADGWAVLRVLVWRERALPAPPPNQVERLPLPGAYVRILTPGNNPRVLARSFTEWRRFPGEPERSAAEALVPVPGIPVTTWNDQPNGNVLAQDQPVLLQVRWDPTFVPGGPEAPAPDLGRLDPAAGNLPADILAGQLPQPLSLRARSRRTLHVVFGTNNQPRLV